MQEDGVDRIAMRLFKSIDTDGKGFLDKKAFRNYTMELLTKLRPSENFDYRAFELGFKKLDVNGDGMINYNEIRSLVKGNL